MHNSKTPLSELLAGSLEAPSQTKNESGVPPLIPGKWYIPLSSKEVLITPAEVNNRMQYVGEEEQGHALTENRIMHIFKDKSGEDALIDDVTIKRLQKADLLRQIDIDGSIQVQQIPTFVTYSFSKEFNIMIAFIISQITGSSPEDPTSSWTIHAITTFIGENRSSVSIGQSQIHEEMPLAELLHDLSEEAAKQNFVIL